MRRTCLAVLLGSLLAVTAHAQVYQWRDAEGRLTYGDQPPPGVDAVLVRTHPAAGSNARAAEAPAPAPAAEASDSTTLSAAERMAVAERAREREEARARACQETRNYLVALESGQRIARFNEKGEREFLDDKARFEQIERTRQTLRENCN